MLEQKIFKVSQINAAARIILEAHILIEGEISNLAEPSFGTACVIYYDPICIQELTQQNMHSIGECSQLAMARNANSLLFANTCFTKTETGTWRATQQLA